MNWQEGGTGHGWVVVSGNISMRRRQLAWPWCMIKHENTEMVRERRQVERYHQVRKQRWGTNCCWWPWLYNNACLISYVIYSQYSQNAGGKHRKSSRDSPRHRVDATEVQRKGQTKEWLSFGKEIWQLQYGFWIPFLWSLGEIRPVESKKEENLETIPPELVNILPRLKRLQMLTKLRIVSWMCYPALSRRAQCNHKCPYKREVRYTSREKRLRCWLWRSKKGMSQGMQAPYGSEKRQGDELFPWASRRNVVLLSFWLQPS